jgi:hypothetical protein
MIWICRRSQGLLRGDSPLAGAGRFCHGSGAYLFCRARNELRALLITQAQAGIGFVLVIGASGASKSSLVRAGLLPGLLLPGLLLPGTSGADPLRALSAAMFSPSALPELADLQYQVETLADQLRQAPQSIAFAVQQGLARAAEGKLTTLGQGHLVVIVDQLEEPFTIESISTRKCDVFVEALAALAQSGLVWVVGRLRGSATCVLGRGCKHRRLGDDGLPSLPRLHMPKPVRPGRTAHCRTEEIGLARGATRRMCKPICIIC